MPGETGPQRLGVGGIALRALAVAVWLLVPVRAWGLQLPEPEPEAGVEAAADTGIDDPYAADADLYAPDAEDGDEEADLSEWLGDDWLEVGEPDPLEPINRPIFGFNNAVETWLLTPMSRGYAFVVPDPGRRAVRRFVDNLASPAIFVNQVLQLKPRRAGVTLVRFTVNSTVGVVGFMDVAAKMGLERDHADFGQTLALLGIASGPYLVIPIFGPSTVRDAVGDLVDRALRPQTYILGIGLLEVILAGAGEGIVRHERYMEHLEALRESSVDFYATMRNVYFQSRAQELRAAGVQADGTGREPRPESEDDAVAEAP